MDRRTFLKQFGALCVTLTGLDKAEAAARSVDEVVGESQRLTILHTNDVHSHIDPFPADDPHYANLGGYARRQAYIEKVRAEGNETLVFECGDMFQGTPYFNFYKGQLEIMLMNRMHIDAVTIGNHEFDNGLSVLCERMEEANFAFVNSNYRFGTQRARDLVKPYCIFERCGHKIGVLGLGVNVNGLITENNLEGTRYTDPVASAQETADRLRSLGCDVVIALSHLGFEMEALPDDKQVASKTRGIDMILGGHTHTFLPEPVFVNNIDGKPVLINQVGYAGINVGRIDIVFNNGQLSFEQQHAVVMA